LVRPIGDNNESTGRPYWVCDRHLFAAIERVDRRYIVLRAPVKLRHPHPCVFSGDVEEPKIGPAKPSVIQHVAAVFDEVGIGTPLRVSDVAKAFSREYPTEEKRPAASAIRYVLKERGIEGIDWDSETKTATLVHDLEWRPRRQG
jgi:hypothetical protein